MPGVTEFKVLLTSIQIAAFLSYSAYLNKLSTWRLFIRAMSEALWNNQDTTGSDKLTAATDSSFFHECDHGSLFDVTMTCCLL
jgi:hypothetical protein